MTGSDGLELLGKNECQKARDTVPLEVKWTHDIFMILQSTPSQIMLTHHLSQRVHSSVAASLQPEQLTGPAGDINWP